MKKGKKFYKNKNALHTFVKIVNNKVFKNIISKITKK